MALGGGPKGMERSLVEESQARLFQLPCCEPHFRLCFEHSRGFRHALLL